MLNVLVRLYPEVRLVGLVIYLLGTALIAKRRFSSFVIIYLFIEMSGSHLIGNGGIPYWMLGYSLVFYFNRYDRDGRGNVFPVEAEGVGNRTSLRKRVRIHDGKITLRK